MKRRPDVLPMSAAIDRLLTDPAAAAGRSKRQPALLLTDGSLVESARRPPSAARRPPPAARRPSPAAARPGRVREDKNRHN